MGLVSGVRGDYKKRIIGDGAISIPTGFVFELIQPACVFDSTRSAGCVSLLATKHHNSGLRLMLALCPYWEVK